jgi:hypothetical protein
MEHKEHCKAEFVACYVPRVTDDDNSRCFILILASFFPRKQETKIKGNSVPAGFQALMGAAS